MYLVFKAESCGMLFGWQSIKMSSTHSVQTSESYCICSLLRRNVIYTYIFFPHSCSRWVRGMIVEVALVTCFSQVSFLSNKAECANSFYYIRCTCPLLLFYTGHTYTAGQCKVFQLTLIPLTFWEQLGSVFCMYTALTTENSMKLWLAHHWSPSYLV